MIVMTEQAFRNQIRIQELREQRLFDEAETDEYAGQGDWYVTLTEGRYMAKYEAMYFEKYSGRPQKKPRNLRQFNQKPELALRFGVVAKTTSLGW